MRRGARGGGGAPPVSFFAFQDLITALTGIMLVVVLVMILEAIFRPEKPADAEFELLRLEAELAALRRPAPTSEPGRRLEIQIDAAAEKMPILIDCRRDGVTVTEPDTKKELLFQDDSAAVSGALAGLEAYLRRCDGDRYWAVLLVRPEAAGYFPALRRRLQARFPRLELGMEPLYDDEEVVAK